MEKELEPIKKWWGNRKENEICWKTDIKSLKENGFDLDVKNPNREEEEIEFSSAELMTQLSASFGKSNELLEQLIKAVE